MGWFWQSTAASSRTTKSPSLPPPTTSNNAPPPTPALREAQSRQDADDAELAKFLNMIQGDNRNESKIQPDRPSHTSASRPLPTSTSAVSQPQPSRASSASAAINEAILPTTMSCKDAFDYAWHCNSPAAQFNAVYRYGAVRSCSDLWDDFWFCMRTKSFSPEMRAEAVRAHFRARQEEKYYAPGKHSSEDIWESRERLVAPGTAFRSPFDDPREDDTEWRLQEMERRRIIREQAFGRD